MELSQWRSFKRHELSAIFPDMTEVEFEGLVADMTENGFNQKQQILLYEGRVLDGWHQLRAAIVTNKMPTFDEYKGKNPLGEVIRRNLHRRHLTTSQRAMIAADISKHRKGIRIVGIPTITEAASLLNVSRDSAQEAAKVLDAPPQLGDAVRNGTVTVSDAASIAELPEEMIKAALKLVKKKKREAEKAKRKEEKAAAKAAGVKLPRKKGKGKKAKKPTLQDAVDEISKSDPDESKEPQTIEEVIKDKNSKLESFCRKIMKLVEEELPEDEWLSYMNRREGALQKFKDACATVRSAKCHSPCPMCKGKACKECQKTGRVPLYIYQQLSK